MNHHYETENEELILRPMNEETSEAYRQLRNRDDNRIYFFHSEPIAKRAQQQWFENYLNKEQECMFAIYRRDDNRFIGGVGIYDIDDVHKRAEVGRILIDSQSAGGRGYGAAALHLCADIAHRQLQMKEIYAYIYADNVRSVKSFRKAGYSIEPTEKEGVVKATFYC